jgi:hypothetical protein
MHGRYALLILPAVGLLLLLIAVMIFVRVRRFVAGALRTQGTVISLTSHMHGSRATYSPVISFTANDGREIEFHDPVSSRPASHKIGDRVEVLYDWQDHSRARLASPLRLYLASSIVGFLGLVFTAIGVAVLWSSF